MDRPEEKECWYSNRTRGKRRQQALEQEQEAPVPEQTSPADDKPCSPEPQAPAAVRRAWAAMIKRVYACPPKPWRRRKVDPLKCPECDGEMYIVSFIDTSQIPAMHSVLVSGKT